MSNLPSIDQASVQKKILALLTEQVKQTVTLEVLAEALRDERDEARQERDAAKFDLQGAQAERDEFSRRLDQLTAPQDEGTILDGTIVEEESWDSQ